MQRKDIKIGAEYAVTLWGTAALGGYGVQKATAVSTDDTDTYRVYGYVRREQRGVRVLIAGEKESRVLPSRQVVGTWEDHQAVAKANSERARQREAKIQSARERREAIKAALAARGLNTDVYTNYSDTTGLNVRLDTLEALLGITAGESE